MPFTNSKGTDNLISGYCVRQDIGIGDPPTYPPLPQPPTTLETIPRCLGTLSESYFNKTKDYRPGFGVVNPVIHFKNAGSCTVGQPAYLYRNYYGMRNVRKLEGHLAAFVQNSSTTSYLPGVAPGDAELQALAKAIGKAIEPQAQLGVTLGELPETIAMFHDPIRKLAHEGQKFRKLLPRNARASLSMLTNAWLQVRYGVMPLIGEIDTYRNVINDGVGQAVSNMLKEKAGWKSPTIKSAVNFVRSAYGLGVYCHGCEEYEKGTEVSATAYYRRTSSFVQSALGLDASQLLSTVWELVPYSFVLDWFIDVGGWLQRLCPTNSVSHLSNCLSLKSYERSTTSVIGISQYQTVSANFPLTACSSVFKFERIAYTRNVNLTLPSFPMVNRRDLGLARTIDSVSLALQRAQNLFTRKR